MRIYDKPLRVGNSDIYTITVAKEWMDGQTLTSVNVVSNDVGIATVEPPTISSGHIISMRITGIAVGLVTLRIDFNTIDPARSDCHKVGLNVVDC